jgi:ABC-type transporter MlaC component
MASSSLNAAGTTGRVTINERIETGQRDRRPVTRVSQAAWRLEQAGRNGRWALVSARAEGISICTLAAAAWLDS